MRRAVICMFLQWARDNGCDFGVVSVCMYVYVYVSVYVFVYVCVVCV